MIRACSHSVSSICIPLLFNVQTFLLSKQWCGSSYKIGEIPSDLYIKHILFDIVSAFVVFKGNSLFLFLSLLIWVWSQPY